MGVSQHVGIGRSPVQTGTIQNTQTSIGDPADLGRAYNWVLVRIPDCSNIAGSTSLRLVLGETANDQMCDFYDSDDSQDLITLPTSGSFRKYFLVMGARRVNVVFTVTPDAATNIEIYGVEPVIDDSEF